VPSRTDSHLPLFSILLRQAREDAGMSQGEVALVIRVNRTTYCNAENGRGTPSVFTKIEDVFPDQADRIRKAWEQKDNRPEEGSETEDDEDMFGSTGRRRQLAGTWHALWETTVQGETVFNREVLQAAWKRGRLEVANDEPSPENPEGGYRWHAELEFADNCYLFGTYHPLDSEVSSKGTMFAVLHRSGKSIRGKWVGCNYDSEIMSGCFVFSKTRDDLARLMKREFCIDILSESPFGRRIEDRRTT